MTDKDTFQTHADALDATIDAAKATPGMIVMDDTMILRDVCRWIAKEEGRREHVSGQPI